MLGFRCGAPDTGILSRFCQESAVSLRIGKADSSPDKAGFGMTMLMCR
jgi:hypothetical protein